MLKMLKKEFRHGYWMCYGKHGVVPSQAQLTDLVKWFMMGALTCAKDMAKDMILQDVMYQEFKCIGTNTTWQADDSWRKLTEED